MLAPTSGFDPAITAVVPAVAFASELLASSVPDTADVTGANALVLPVSVPAVLAADVTVDTAGATALVTVETAGCTAAVTVETTGVNGVDALVLPVVPATTEVTPLTAEDTGAVNPVLPVTLASAGCTAAVTVETAEDNGALKPVLASTGCVTDVTGAVSVCTEAVALSSAGATPCESTDTAAVFPPLSRLMPATLPLAVVGASKPTPSGALEPPTVALATLP
jgi:hypothetical protein